MLKAERGGVQSEPGREGTAGRIDILTEDRVSKLHEVDSDLVGSACKELDLKRRRVGAPSDDTVAGERPFPFHLAGGGGRAKRMMAPAPFI